MIVIPSAVEGACVFLNLQRDYFINLRVLCGEQIFVVNK